MNLDLLRLAPFNLNDAAVDWVRGMAGSHAPENRR